MKDSQDIQGDSVWWHLPGKGAGAKILSPGFSSHLFPPRRPLRPQVATTAPPPRAATHSPWCVSDFLGSHPAHRLLWKFRPTCAASHHWAGPPPHHLQDKPHHRWPYLLFPKTVCHCSHLKAQGQECSVPCDWVQQPSPWSDCFWSLGSSSPLSQVSPPLSAQLHQLWWLPHLLWLSVTMWWCFLSAAGPWPQSPLPNC